MEKAREQQEPGSVSRRRGVARPSAHRIAAASRSRGAFREEGLSEAAVGSPSARGLTAFLVCFRSALSVGRPLPAPPEDLPFTASKVGLAPLQSALAKRGRAQAPRGLRVACSSAPG